MLYLDDGTGTERQEVGMLKTKNEEDAEVRRENVAHINLSVEALTVAHGDTGGQCERWRSKLQTEAVVGVPSPWFASLFTSKWTFAVDQKSIPVPLPSAPFYPILSLPMTSSLCWEPTLITEVLQRRRFVKGFISGNKVMLRSRCVSTACGCDLVDHQHTCCWGRKTNRRHLCIKLLKMKEMSEQVERGRN